MSAKYQKSYSQGKRKSLKGYSHRTHRSKKGQKFNTREDWFASKVYKKKLRKLKDYESRRNINRALETGDI